MTPASPPSLTESLRAARAGASDVDRAETAAHEPCTADPTADAASLPNASLVHITTVPQSLWFLTGQVTYMKVRGLAIQAISSPGPLLQRFAEQEEIPTHAVPMARAITPWQDLRAVAEIWRLLRRIRPDIVHTHTPKGGLLGMLAAWLARVPVRVYHMRGLPHLTARGLRRLLLRTSEAVSCRLAHRVFCVSRSIRDVAVNERLCPAERVHVLGQGSGNGVDATHRFNPDRAAVDARRTTRLHYDLPDDALVIGFIGRVVRSKGVVELAEAWESIRDRFPHAYLLLIGPTEAEDPVPPELLARLQKDPHVRLAGEQWNTPPLYCAMDLLALPTYREGFPNVLLEAGAMRLPVVATRVPGCVDAVIDGVTGTLVPPYEPAPLAAALMRYLDQPELRTRHGAAGRDRVLRAFQPAQLWASLHAEYRGLLARRTNGRTEARP